MSTSITNPFAGSIRETLDVLFVKGELDRVEEFVHPDFVNHEAAAHRPPGPDGFRETLTWLREAFSEIAFDVQDVIADGDRVCVRYVFSGVHTGALMGMPATGRSFAVQHIHIFRLRDGLVIEHWACRDDVGHMAQLGLIEAPRNPR